MRQEITARVKIDSDNVQVIVRKAVFREGGTVDKKYGLSREGDWLEVPKAAMYPEECYLPVEVFKGMDTSKEQDSVEPEELIKTSPKCPDCGGKGFDEKEHGVIQIACQTCKGTGKVADVLTLENLEKIREALPPQEVTYVEELNKEVTPDIPKNFVGLLFQLAGKITSDDTDELWTKAKQAAVDKMEFPYRVKMPCGFNMEFIEADDIFRLKQDLSCPCERPGHYVFRFEDKREVRHDDSTIRAGEDNQPTGSGDTRKPAKPKKPKTKKKARKGSR